MKFEVKTAFQDGFAISVQDIICKCIVGGYKDGYAFEPFIFLVLNMDVKGVSSQQFFEIINRDLGNPGFFHQCQCLVQ